jgi:hypothetical protein
MQIDVPGNFNIDIEQRNSSNEGKDVDFVAWGPFSSVSEACTVISDNPNNGHIIDCSYSPNSEETCHIQDAQNGQVYVLLLTNYSNAPANILFKKNPYSGTATTDCGIITPPIINNGPLCLGDTLQLTVTTPVAGAAYLWTGPNGWISTTQNPTISDVSVANAGTYSLAVTANGETASPKTTDVVVNLPSDTTFVNEDICSNNLPYSDNGFNVSEAGKYFLTLQNTNGCDSVVTLHLTVYPTFELTDAITICDSELPFTYRDTTFEAGTLTDDFVFNRTTIFGCDSTVMLHLNVRATFTAEIGDIAEICGDDGNFSIPYTLFNGSVEYQSVIFDEKAKLARFRDIEQEPARYDFVTVPLPSIVRPDNYKAVLLFQNGDFSAEYEVKFTVLYPSSPVIRQKWNDVLALTNEKYNLGHYTFSAYQWYKNGEPIYGATGSYLYVGPNEILDFEAEYRALLTRSDDGITLLTCPLQPVPHYDNLSYPTFLDAGQTFNVSTASAGRISFFTLSGIKIADKIAVEGQNLLIAPQQQGNYLMVIDDLQGGVERVKLIVK